MLCCSCNEGTLMPTRIDDGPVCYLCNACGGALLSLAPYLDWAKSKHAQTVPASETATHFEGEAKDSKKALSCPKCSRLMLRFNVLADDEALPGLDDLPLRDRTRRCRRTAATVTIQRRLPQRCGFPMDARLP